MTPPASLRRHPARYAFVRAVAELQAAVPGSVPVGGLGPPEREAVRLRPSLDLAFPTADVAAVDELPEVPEGGPRYRCETTFFGLYGQGSPLPTYFTERLLERDEPDPVRAFIDLFHHRMLSLFWRALVTYRLTAGEGHRDHLLALVGAYDARHGEGVRRLLACAGLFAQQPRSATCLQAVLAHWLGGVPVAVESCAPRWSPLPEERQARLGRANVRLGRDCLAGERIHNRTTAFRVAVGPVSPQVYRRLLPGGPDRALLQAVVDEFNDERLDMLLDCVLDAAEVPPARLGDDARLGWDLRLAGAAPPSHTVRFTVEAA